MKQVVSFDKLKLTNHQLDDNGHVSTRDLGSYFIYQKSEISKEVYRCLNKKSSIEIVGHFKFDASVPAQASCHLQPSKA